jgi:hypothetical protein
MLFGWVSTEEHSIAWCTIGLKNVIQYDILKCIKQKKCRLFFNTVHKLIADEDYGTLRTMASSKLVDAIEATGKEYRSAGLVWRTEIDTDKPIDAQLRYFTTWDRRTIENYDEDKVGSSVPTGPYPTGQWLVFWIQFKAGQQTVVTREEDGSVVARIVDDRPSLWTFACGPLPPDLPVRQLDTPLWLLKFN